MRATVPQRLRIIFVIVYETVRIALIYIESNTGVAILDGMAT